MKICGVALGCGLLALGALLAYIGMAALMEMTLGRDHGDTLVVPGVSPSW